MKNILFLIGGRSGEHEISLISAKHVVAALDREKYKPVVVVIQKEGEMQLIPEDLLVGLSNDPNDLKTPRGKEVSFYPHPKNGRFELKAGEESLAYDIVFPVLHGPGGEDGSIQGMFGAIGAPVVGCGVKASAVCMDKAVTKHLCERAGIATTPFIELYDGDPIPEIKWDYPWFVKPASNGSSLGVSKVDDFKALEKALEDAFKHDSKILIEKGMKGREIEIAVLGKRGDLKVSPVGEIGVKEGFYSYNAKYVDLEAVELLAPTELEPGMDKEIEALAKQIFQTLDCSGMARIDFFLSDEDNRFYLNEVNTIPGFTPISMYPKLMQLTGISYQDLISALIELA